MIKVSTGVKGLDEMLEGGFPKGRIILVCGGPGAGKTMLAIQFLMAAVERGEPSVYASLEEPLSLIRQNVEDFGWDIKAKEDSGLLRLMDFCAIPYESFIQFKTRNSGENNILSVIDELEKAAKEMDAKNIVVDPITSITIHEQKAGMKRYRIAELFNRLRKTGCTSLVISESVPSAGEYYIEHFLADGVIILEKTVLNFNLLKTMRIEKMRGMAYDEQPRRYAIDKRGFVVYSTEPVRLPVKPM
jgi:KaiC/GvpD/RAD55 family RecA-like ATPase